MWSVRKTYLAKENLFLGSYFQATKFFRDSIRNRAKQLVAWILESGNDLKLGITKMDILNGQIVKKRSQSATSRADLWAQRYFSQNFAAWNSPAGKVKWIMFSIQNWLILVFSKVFTISGSCGKKLFWGVLFAKKLPLENKKGIYRIRKECDRILIFANFVKKHQWNFQPFQQMGDITMQTPDLIRTSLCIEDENTDSESGKVFFYYFELQKWEKTYFSDQTKRSTILQQELLAAAPELKIVKRKFSEFKG